MALDDDEKRRIARALWSYTGMKQPDLNAELGWSKDRLRSMLGKGPHSAPTTDELLAIAELAGVPSAIAIDGWAAADPAARLQDEISELRRSVQSLSAQVAMHGRELRALRGQGHDAGSTGAARR